MKSSTAAQRLDAWALSKRDSILGICGMAEGDKSKCECVWLQEEQCRWGGRSLSLVSLLYVHVSGRAQQAFASMGFCCKFMATVCGQ